LHKLRCYRASTAKACIDILGILLHRKKLGGGLWS